MAVEKERQFSDKVICGQLDADSQILAARRRMSDCGAAIREPSNMAKLLEKTRLDLAQMEAQIHVASKSELYKAYQYRDTLVCQIVTLSAMLNFTESVGTTRGSALYFSESGQKRGNLEECFRFRSEPKACADRVQQGVLEGDSCKFLWREVRKIPDSDAFFENVWRGYRLNRNIF